MSPTAAAVIVAVTSALATSARPADVSEPARLWLTAGASAELPSASKRAPSRAEDATVARIVSVLPPGNRPTVPIHVVDPRTVGKRTSPGAFTRDGDPTIYLSDQTVAYRLARDGDSYATAVLASCLWHEEQHVQGHGEVDAYRAQIELVGFLIRTLRMESTRGEMLLKSLRELRRQAGATTSARR